MHQVQPSTARGQSHDADGDPPQHASLRSTTFIGLLVTQFLGAANDNILRWLVIGIGKEYVDKQHISAVLAVGSGCLVLPYLILAAPAGYLADRYSKREVIVRCKLAEIVIMALAIAAILIGNIYFMFVVVALIGSQAALFGPAKLGSIPEMLQSEQDLGGERLDWTDDRDRHGRRHRRWQLAVDWRKSPACTAESDGGFRRWCCWAWRLPDGSPACSSCACRRRIRVACFRETSRNRRCAI